MTDMDDENVIAKVDVALATCKSFIMDNLQEDSSKNLRRWNFGMQFFCCFLG